MHGTYAWQNHPDSVPTLSDISLSVPKGALCMVVGAVGSGKSSLLAAMLGEMHSVRGSAAVNGTMAYTSQVCPTLPNCVPYQHQTLGCYSMHDTACGCPQPLHRNGLAHTAHAQLRVQWCTSVQDPWIQNATVRDNILMGAAADKERYSAVVAACALEQDLATLPKGDATEIGEKGVTLSGAGCPASAA